MKNKMLLFLLICIAQQKLFAQNVAINSTGTAPHPSAMLDISAPNKGLLITRVNLASATDATTIVNTATSLLVFNTNTLMGVGYYYNHGTAVSPSWVKLQTNSMLTGWSVTGNAGTDTSLHFMGTTDATDLVVKINNRRRMTITQKGTFNLSGDSSNTIIGDSAGAFKSTGNFNHFVGYHAGKLNTTGYYNYFSGYKAGTSNTTGNINHFEGLAAGVSYTTGSENYFAGVNAGFRLD